jgi:hypothetical protein
VNSELYLSVPANRELVRSVVSRVLLMLEPSGTELKLGYLEPLIDLAAKNEVIVADLWDEAGRFGSADLLGPVVVPLVLQALAATNSGMVTISREDIKRMVLRVRSPQARRRVGEIEQAIKAALSGVRSAAPEEHRAG